jgi:P27 family predicted phage terminase small subunit
MPAPVGSWYERLARIVDPMRVGTEADGLALELAASALAEYEAAARVILADGPTYEARTEAGAIMHRARPEQAIAADAWRRAMSMLLQFGLTPASRSKVEARPEFEPENASDAGPLALLRLQAARAGLRKGLAP